MTAHELAKQLLLGPDCDVFVECGEPWRPRYQHGIFYYACDVDDTDIYDPVEPQLATPVILSESGCYR